MDEVVLYATEACHLCDLAVVEIEQALCVFPDRQIAYVDIAAGDSAESEELIARYAELIPLLVNEKTGESLAWPFTAQDVQAWLIFR
jgi:hypothetical protein